MKRTAVLASLLMWLLISGDQANAKCSSILVQVHGDVVGQMQEGDGLFLRFIYSSTRVETSSPQPVKGKTFVLVAAYSTYKRRGIFHADVCGAAPRQIQLVMRDRNGAVLDTVDLMNPDERTGDTAEVSYGKKQVVVVHRQLAFHS
jgi:hypothetical protein